MSIGSEHVRLYDRLRRTTGDHSGSLGRIVDWGCGGGANAVAFAGMADEVVGVDVNERSLDEARRQVERTSRTPFTGIIVDLAEPERAVAKIPRPCDFFLCLYVLELVPTPEYGLRIMRIAHDLLRPEVVNLVPRNDLDERYAYFLLTRP